MLKNIMVSGIIITLVIVMLPVLYVYVPKLLIKPEGKFTVLMAGRSVTEQWFRRRELPEFLNELSIWREWPIPHNKHIEDDVYYEQLYLPSPRTNYNKPGFVYGEQAINAIQKALKEKHFDAMLFKFCFVDFRDSSLKENADVNEQFHEMTSFVEDIHGIAKMNNTSLILGTALPILEPDIKSQQLRIRYNQWVEEYSHQHQDTIKLELFNNLINSDGKLRVDYSLDPGDNDSHLNKKAYEILEQELSQTLVNIRNKNYTAPRK